jgi:hypothetical protein
MPIATYDEWTVQVYERFMWLWGRQIDEHLRLQFDPLHDEEFTQFKRALVACFPEED